MKADKILKNGKIYSVNQDDSITRGSAIAIKDGRILDIGSDLQIEAYLGENSTVIDCGGNTILPGLCDAHCHPSFTASATSGCNLFNVYREEHESCQTVIDRYMKRLKDYVDEHPEEELIRGTGWILAHFNGASGETRMPTRHDIDKICPDKPVILESFCQHNLWVNTKALSVAGIDENTPEPVAGKIDREANGYPQGVLQEMEAIDLIKENISGYDYSAEKYKEAIRYYQKELANKYGITLVQDALHSENAKEAYRQMAQDEELTVRMRGVYPLEPKKAKNQIEVILTGKGKDNVKDLFEINTVKIFSEGEFTTCEPYEKEFLRVRGLPEDYCGNLFWEDDELTGYMEKAMRAGLQLHVHAMGDRAVKQSVDCIVKAQNRTGAQLRNVIAHLMIVRDEDAKRMGEAGILGNCQPRWMVYDTDVDGGYVPSIGPERAEQVFPHKKLLDAGCIITYGTDFPVTPPPDPFHEIQCALSRSVFPDAPDYSRFKGRVLAPEERVTLKDAVKCLTWSGAYQSFLEQVTGTIEIGKSADLVILDRDIEAAPIDKIYDIKVKQTIFKGEIVYED